MVGRSSEPRRKRGCQLLTGRLGDPALVRLRVRTNSGVKVPVGQKHWLSVAEGNCVVERRGGGQPEANNQSINKKMMN